MRKSILIGSSSYKGINILADEEKGHYCRQELLDKFYSLLTHYTNKHCKVRFIRFDLRYPDWYQANSNNGEISRFTDSLKKYLQRLTFEGGHKADPKYFWVQERKTSNNPHFHFILLVNGNAVKQHWYILEKAESLWGRALGTKTLELSKGLLNKCDKDANRNPQNNYIKIDRNHFSCQEAFNNCIRWSSYLCKDTTKGQLTLRANSFGMSSIN